MKNSQNLQSIKIILQQVLWVIPLYLSISGLLYPRYGLAQFKDIPYINLNRQLETPISGIVGDKDSYVFTLSDSSAMLIEVQPLNTDFYLVLRNKRGDIIYTVSLPPRVWLAERILVEAKDCIECRLEIRAREKVDESGRYQLVAKKLHSNSDEAELAFESKMTEASVQWYKAGYDLKKLAKVHQLYNQAVALAYALNYPEAIQRSRYFAGQAAHWGEQKEPLYRLITAVAGANLYPNDPYRLRAHFLLAELARENQNLDSVMQHLKVAQSLAIAQNDYLMLASIRALYGLVAASQGDAKEAYRLFEQSYETFFNLGDMRKAVNELINKGWSSYVEGKLETALYYYLQALSVAGSTGMRYQEIDASYHIGLVYSRWLDIDQANYYIDSAMQKVEVFRDYFLYGMVLHAKAKVLSNVGMYDLAKVYFEEALQTFTQAQAKEYTIDTLFSLGDVYKNTRDFKKSEKIFEQVIEHSLSTKNHYYLAKGYFKLANIALNQGNFKQALMFQDSAFTNNEHIDDEFFKGRLMSQAAFIYFHNNLIQPSNEYFSRALALQKEHNDFEGQIETGYRRARVKSALGNRMEAINILQEISDNIQLRREKISRVDLRQSYLSLQQKISALHIHLLIDNGDSAINTLQFAEEFRSQTLTERLISEGKTRIVPPDLILKRKKLQSEIQEKAIDYYQLSEPSFREKLLRKTRKLSEQLQQLETKIEQLPSTLTAQKESGKVANISQIQNSLKPDSLILYFDTNIEQSYLWTMTSSTVNVFNIPSSEVIAAQVEKVLALTRTKPKFGKKRGKNQADAYKNLSELLFGNTIIDWEKFSKIIVVTDGPINYLPLSILTLPRQKQNILATKQVVFTPSLAIFEQLRSAPLKSQKDELLYQALIVANPSFIDESQIPLASSGMRGGFQSSELPYTKKEAESIMKVASAHTTLLSEKFANKSGFYAQNPRSFDIIHFATHALASSESPLLNGLVLSNILAGDNLLLAPEISNLKLEAELVVLSGCDTAIGRLVDGEGLQSLSRSFFEGGAKRVIASLWPVQDDATAELMGAFYTFLLHEKLSPAESLRLAKKHVKNFRRKNNQKPWQDPYYWAGFVIQGLGERWIE